jgi:D-sedoheptulose 7-phosphate isomerase
METWSSYVDTIADGLRQMVITDHAGAALTPAAGIERWVGLTRAAHDRDGTLYLIGNGGSAAMASHMAADACKNGFLRALALNDAALVTATSNDVSFEDVFALPLARLARPGDLLITISSSGNSPNVLRALEVARATGIGTVTLSAKQPDNHSRKLGDLNFYVPLARYGWAESAHQILLHHWFDQYLHVHGEGAL